MEISQLGITHFRNLTDVKLELHPQLNIIYGDNGQGKTSLLEALFSIAWGKGFRNAKVNQLLQWQQSQAAINLKVKADSGLIEEVEFQFTADTRIWQLRGKTYKRAKEIRNVFKVIPFIPDLTRLFRESPGARRDYFDYAIGNLHQSYTGLLRDYEKCLSSRNLLLKMRQSGDELASFSEQLASLALSLDQQRRHFLQELSPYLVARFNGIAQFGLDLTITYSSAYNSVEDYLMAYENKLAIELEAGHTLVGPHREDYIINFNQVLLKDHASQGQHRLFVLALILAEMDLLKANYNISPIFLLDDLGSELDAKRVDFLIAQINAAACQCLLTTTRREFFSNSANCRYFKVQNGDVQPQV